MSSRLLSCLAVCVLAGVVSAQASGPDVIVGDVVGVSNYGAVSGVAGFSIGTTSCNIGTTTLKWIANTNEHPVIAQNVYRLKNGRFEHIGMSWLKHGFTALAGSLCNPCQNPGTGSLLGVNCSDPYGSSLNGSQSGLGPRSEVNASTGVFPYPFGTGSGIQNLLSRRINIATVDTDPALNAGALYYAEGHYVTQDDAAAGNKNNNASYRRATFSNATTMALTSSTVRELPAIYAWQANDAAVNIQIIDFMNDGRVFVAHKITPIGGGLFHHEYAVHNLSSDRSVGEFEVLLPNGTTVSNVGFHSPDYHSGEPYPNAPWSHAPSANGYKWATDSWFVNNNANAIRWGTLYNFWFDSTAAATGVNLTPFKPDTSNCPPPVPVPPTNNGYTLVNNAAYDFVSIAGISTPGPTTDDSSVTANLGFTFPFYGTSMTQVVVSSNGYLTLPGQNGGVFSNTALPNGATPNGMICGFWDDLNPAIVNSGQISFATVGTAPNRRFVVHYNGVFRFGTTTPENFQIILEEDGDIVSTIVSSGSGGNSATRGIEDPTGTIGLQGSFNTANSAMAMTTWRYNRTLGVTPVSAELDVIGNGAPNSFVGVYVHSSVFKPLLILADYFPGATPIPGVGVSGLAWSPGLFAVIDAFGIFAPANPTAFTDQCGEFTIGITTGPAGLPSGLTLYFEAYVVDPAAPNGIAHISDVGVLTVP